MDRNIDETLTDFCYDVRDLTTNEVYEHYVDVCKKYGDEIKCKQQVIRTVCQAMNLRLEKRTIKVFKPGDKHDS